MGRTVVCNYEIQVEKSFSNFSIQGAMRFKDAFNLAIEEMIRLKSRIAYIWPQTYTARKLINNNYRGEYVKINPSGGIEGMKMEGVKQ